MLKVSKLLILSTLPVATVSTTTVPVLCLAFQQHNEFTPIILPKEYLTIEDGVLKGFSPKATMSEMFYGGYNVIEIPEEVVEIAPYAFAYHLDLRTNLITSIDFSKATNLQKIGDNAFNYCDMLNCDIDLSNCQNLKYIGNNAFFYCAAIKSLKFNDNVSDLVIGDHAFTLCAVLTELTIPKGVSEIKNNAFEDCVKLKTIDMTGYASVPDWLLSSSGVFNRAGSTSEAEKNIIKVKYANVSPKQWKYLLQEHQQLSEDRWDIASAHPTTKTDFNYDGETTITGLKGEASSFDSLVIPDNVTYIAKDAFDTKFTSGSIPLILPEGITTIDEDAFKGCTGLTGDLDLPAHLTNLGARAFQGCTNLRGHITIPSGIKEIKYDTFNGSGIDGVIFHDKFETIGKNAFSNCSNLSYMDVSCYTNTAPWKTDATKDTEQPFYGSNSNGFIYVFNYGDPDYIKQLWFSAFKQFGLGESVTQDETDLTKWGLHLCDENAKKAIPTMAFNAINNYDLRGLRQAYKPIEAIMGYGQVQIPDGIGIIGKNAFKDQFATDQHSWNLRLNEGLKSIKESAFEGDNALNGDLIIPETVTEIGNKAFNNCSSLQGTLKIPESVKSIGTIAFANTSFSRITLPKNFKDIQFSKTNYSFLLNPRTKILDMSKVDDLPTAEHFTPWVYFGSESKGQVLIPDNSTSALLYQFYFQSLNVNWNPDNWPLVRAK